MRAADATDAPSPSQQQQQQQQQQQLEEDKEDHQHEVQEWAGARRKPQEGDEGEDGWPGSAHPLPRPPRLRRLSPPPRRAPSAALQRRVRQEAAGWGPREITTALNNAATVDEVEAIWLAIQGGHALNYRHLTAVVQALGRVAGRRGRGAAPGTREQVRQRDACAGPRPEA